MPARKMYMHLVDGKPGYYTRGYQVAFATTGRYARKGIPLAESLQQIKAEQRASIKWRVARGFPADTLEYGYAVVEVGR